MNGIILAGGKSSRMGTNKAFLKIGDKAIIDIILERLKNFCSEITIVTNNFEDFRYTGVRLLGDMIPVSCSLVGLYSGLHHAKNEYSFVVACDMPFINEEMVRYMNECRAGVDIVAPIVNGEVEPLFAIYSKNCIKEIKRQIDAQNFRINDVYKRLKVRLIGEDEIRNFDPLMKSFINLNTITDYMKFKENANLQSID